MLADSEKLAASYRVPEIIDFFATQVEYPALYEVIRHAVVQVRPFSHPVWDHSFLEHGFYDRAEYLTKDYELLNDGRRSTYFRLLRILAWLAFPIRLVWTSW
jgi:hypothetical protein